VKYPLIDWRSAPGTFVPPPNPKTEVLGKLVADSLAEKLGAHGKPFEPFKQLKEVTTFLIHKVPIPANYYMENGKQIFVKSARDPVLEEYRRYLRRNRDRCVLIRIKDNRPVSDIKSLFPVVKAEFTWIEMRRYPRWGTIVREGGELYDVTDCVWVPASQLPTPSEIFRKAKEMSLEFRVESTEMTEVEVSNPFLEKHVLVPRNPDGTNVFDSKSEVAIVWARALWMVGLPWEVQYKNLMRLQDAETIATHIKDMSWECMKALLHGYTIYPHIGDIGTATLYRAARALPKPPKLVDARDGMGLLFTPVSQKLFSQSEILQALNEMPFQSIVRTPEESISSPGSTLEFSRGDGGTNLAIYKLSNTQLLTEPSDIKEAIVQGTIQNRKMFSSAVARALEMFQVLKHRLPVCAALDIPERGWKHRIPTVAETVAVILAHELGRWFRVFLTDMFRDTFRQDNYETIEDSPTYTSGDFTAASDGLDFIAGRIIAKYGRKQTPLGDEWDEVIDWLIGPWMVYNFHPSVRYALSCIWKNHEKPVIAELEVTHRTGGLKANRLFGSLDEYLKPKMRFSQSNKEFYEVEKLDLYEAVQQTDGSHVSRRAIKRIDDHIALAGALLHFPQSFATQPRISKRGVLMGLGLTQFVVYIANYIPHIRMGMKQQKRKSQVIMKGDDNVSTHMSKRDAELFEAMKERTGMVINKEKTIISDRGFTIAQRIFVKRTIDGIRTRVEIPSLALKQCIITERSLNDYVNKPGAVLKSTTGKLSQYRVKAMSLLYQAMRSSYETLERDGVDLFDPYYGLLPNLRRRDPLKVKPANNCNALWVPRVTNSIPIKTLMVELPALRVEPHTFPVVGNKWRTRDIPFDSLVGMYTSSKQKNFKPSYQMKYTSKTYEMRVSRVEDENPPERVTTDIPALVEGLSRPPQPCSDTEVMNPPFHFVDYYNVGQPVLSRIVANTEGTIFICVDGLRETQSIKRDGRWVITLPGNADHTIVGMMKWLKRVWKGCDYTKVFVYTNDATERNSIVRRLGHIPVIIRTSAYVKDVWPDDCPLVRELVGDHAPMRHRPRKPVEVSVPTVNISALQNTFTPGGDSSTEVKTVFLDKNSHEMTKIDTSVTQVYNPLLEVIQSIDANLNVKRERIEEEWYRLFRIGESATGDALLPSSPALYQFVQQYPPVGVPEGFMAYYSKLMSMIYWFNVGGLTEQQFVEMLPQIVIYLVSAEQREWVNRLPIPEIRVPAINEGDSWDVSIEHESHEVYNIVRTDLEDNTRTGRAYDAPADPIPEIGNARRAEYQFQQQRERTEWVTEVFFQKSIIDLQTRDALREYESVSFGKFELRVGSGVPAFPLVVLEPNAKIAGKIPKPIIQKDDPYEFKLNLLYKTRRTYDQVCLHETLVSMSKNSIDDTVYIWQNGHAVHLFAEPSKFSSKEYSWRKP